MIGEIVFWGYLAGWAIAGLTPAVLKAFRRWPGNDHWQFVALGGLWPLLIVVVPFVIVEEWHHRREETIDG